MACITAIVIEVYIEFVAQSSTAIDSFQIDVVLT